MMLNQFAKSSVALRWLTLEKCGKGMQGQPLGSRTLCLTGEYATGCANLPLYFCFQKTPYSSKYRFYSLLHNSLAKLDK